MCTVRGHGQPYAILSLASPREQSLLVVGEGGKEKKRKGWMLMVDYREGVHGQHHTQGRVRPSGQGKMEYGSKWVVQTAPCSQHKKSPEKLLGAKMGEHSERATPHYSRIITPPPLPPLPPPRQPLPRRSPPQLFLQHPWRCRQQSTSRRMRKKSTHPHRNSRTAHFKV